MLRTPRPDGVWLVTQPDHGELAGTLAAPPPIGKHRKSGDPLGKQASHPEPSPALG